MTNLDLAGRRAELLFVTHRSALAARYGASDVDELFQAFAGKARLLDVNTSSVREAAQRVREAIASEPGVVLLGGYDVVPAQRMFCVPAGSTASPDDDPNDRFVVWSDDPYGDVDGDGLPDRPVSRIPDAGSLEFLVGCLNAPALRSSPPYGLINHRRPFADEVFRTIQGAESGWLQHSSPINLHSVEENDHPDWHALRVGYLMLHGSSDNGALFHGEERMSKQIVAFSPAYLPALDGGFVFAGCCWGALIGAAAVEAPPGEPLRMRTPEQSIALTALARGAAAFIGSTGLVMSPSRGDAEGVGHAADYYCKPLHAAFWRHCAEGLAPARALLEAKLDYLCGIPHPGASPVTSDVQIAQEIKHFCEMTCLGLGW